MGLFGQMFQLLVTGVTIGSIYAMVAVGFNMIYNATDVVNFAQGEFVIWVPPWLWFPSLPSGVSICLWPFS